MTFSISFRNYGLLLDHLVLKALQPTQVDYEIVQTLLEFNLVLKQLKILFCNFVKSKYSSFGPSCPSKFLRLIFFLEQLHHCLFSCITVSCQQDNDIFS